jgi:regulatory protein
MHHEEKRPHQRKPLAEIRQKAYRFCSLQERSPYEMKQKLYSWGLHRAEVEQMVIDLLEDNFLNEARFAQTYAGGKFRILNWGKLKIIQGLKKHQVSQRNIQDALREQIPDEAYHTTLRKLVQDKLIERLDRQKTPTTTNRLDLKAAVWLYIHSKGYHQPDFERAWQTILASKTVESEEVLEVPRGNPHER